MRMRNTLGPCCMFIALIGALSTCQRVSSTTRISIQNSLRDPSKVVDVIDDTLVLADGSKREVVGIGRCLASSPGVQAILDNGVELSADSQDVHCLVTVFHKCGNDPIQAQT